MLTLNRVEKTTTGTRFTSLGNYAKMRQCRREARADSLSRKAAGKGRCWYVLYSEGYKFRGRIDVVVVAAERAVPAIPEFSLN